MNKKNKILAGCLALLLALSVGYALFSDTITINGTATAKGSFDINTTCINGISQELQPATQQAGWPKEGGYENESCEVVDDTITINVGLKYPTARKYYTIKVVNEGTMDATLDLKAAADTIDGQFCKADNKEGLNAKCEENKEIGNNFSVGESSMIDGLLIPIAFLKEDGTLVVNSEIGNDFFDATNYIVTLKPNQTALFLVDVYMHEAFTLGNFGNTGEFFASRTLTIEHPWQQKAN